MAVPVNDKNVTIQETDDEHYLYEKNHQLHLILAMFSCNLGFKIDNTSIFGIFWQEIPISALSLPSKLLLTSIISITMVTQTMVQ
jgi:hypothetical protein